MSSLAPRAPEEIMRPRRSSGVVVRPLNFTVRSHFGETSVAKSKERLRLAGRCVGELANTLVLAGVFVRRIRRACAAAATSVGVGARARSVGQAAVDQSSGSFVNRLDGHA